MRKLIFDKNNTYLCFAIQLLFLFLFLPKDSLQAQIYENYSNNIKISLRNAEASEKELLNKINLNQKEPIDVYEFTLNNQYLLFNLSFYFYATDFFIRSLKFNRNDLVFDKKQDVENVNNFIDDINKFTENYDYYWNLFLTKSNIFSGLLPIAELNKITYNDQHTKNIKSEIKKSDGKVATLYIVDDAFKLISRGDYERGYGLLFGIGRIKIAFLTGLIWNFGKDPNAEKKFNVLHKDLIAYFNFIYTTIQVFSTLSDNDKELLNLFRDKKSIFDQEIYPKIEKYLHADNKWEFNEANSDLFSCFNLSLK